MTLPWGKKAVRVAIAIGKDADHQVLQKFIGHNELQVLEANNPEALLQRIRWVSSAVLQAVSTPPSKPREDGAPTLNVPLPKPPEVGQASPDEVW